MKKLLVGLLAAFVLMVMVVGCDGEVTPVENSGSENGEEQEMDDNGDNGSEDDSDQDTEEDASGDVDEDVEGADNSRTNPAGIGERYIVDKDDWLVGKVTYEIEMIGLISGDEAWDIIKDANMFNDEPDEGMEYIMAEFEVTVVETEEDDAFDTWMGISWSAVSGDGVQYDDFIVVSGIQKLEADLYEGASTTGYQVFMVNVDDGNPVAAHDRRSNTEIWFDLRGNQ